MLRPLVLVSVFAISSAAQCVMVPFENDELIGHCCVYFKNKSGNSSNVPSKKDIEKQLQGELAKNLTQSRIHTNKSTGSSGSTEEVVTTTKSYNEKKKYEDGVLLFPGEFYHNKKEEEEHYKKYHNNATNETETTTRKSEENTTITNTNRNGVAVPDSPCPDGQAREVGSGNCVEEL